MATQNLIQGFGLGTYKIQEGTASLANGGTITAANLHTVLAVELTAVAASGSYAIANVISISGNVVTIGLSGAAAGTAPATLTSATTVHYVIIGQ
jgi:hypothetical protein